jgi:hypothetical protein
MLGGSGANFLGISFSLARGFSDFKPPGLRPMSKSHVEPANFT